MFADSTCGEESGFALEPSQAFLVTCELLGKDFDGNVSSEFGIPGSINLAHPSLADGLEDLVVREFRAG